MMKAIWGVTPEAIMGRDRVLEADLEVRDLRGTLRLKWIRLLLTLDRGWRCRRTIFHSVLSSIMPLLAVLYAVFIWRQLLWTYPAPAVQ